MFHHLPKCGGTSIRRAIAHHHSPRASARLDARASRAASEYLSKDLDTYREEILLYYLAQPDLRFVSGHFPFSELAYQTFGHRWEFITILRDPISRWFSHYFFNRYKTDEHFRFHDDLESFVDSDVGERLGRFYVDKFAPGWAHETTLDHAIDTAKSNLTKFSVVGCLERLDDFVANFEEHYAVKLRIGHLMKSPITQGERKQQITDSTRNKVEKICQPDMEIYRFAMTELGRL